MADQDAGKRRARLKQILRGQDGGDAIGAPARNGADAQVRTRRLEDDPEWQAYAARRTEAERLGVDDPYFRCTDGLIQGTAVTEGRATINFANYNYLGLNGAPAVTASAKQAIDMHGTSVSASRLVSGERPVHQQLEAALADLHGTESALAFVSGFGTNVATIAQLVGPGDLIIYDALAHNSALQGALLSRATRLAFAHNDINALADMLVRTRGQHGRTLVFVEAVYSMDGDIADVPAIIALRERFDFMLMVDEAHSIGVLGATGKGVGEHFGLAPGDVDIWMGTLSKTLASCGGYIAGSQMLIDYAKYCAGGFVYSVGLSPPNAAAALAALNMMHAEPERVARLRELADRFRSRARAQGLEIGLSGGSAVVPVIIGDSFRAIALSNALFARGIDVQPILFPAVAEQSARLRFFITAAHTHAQIDQAVDTVRDALDRIEMP